MRQFNSAFNNIIRFAAAVFTVCALTAHAQSNAEAQNSIQSLSLNSAQGGVLVLKVELKSALANPPAGFTINTPPRIVTLDNISINPSAAQLSMDATAKTYRYLDEEELAAQKKAAKPAAATAGAKK